MQKKRKENMPHILNTASNLLGLCFFVVTYLKTTGYTDTLIDKLVGVNAILFALCCLFSFLSMRSKNEEKVYKYELVADYLFFVGILIFVAIIMASWLRLF